MERELLRTSRREECPKLVREAGDGEVVKFCTDHSGDETRERVCK